MPKLPSYICVAIQVTGFYIMATLAFNELDGVCFEQTEPFTSLLKATYSRGVFDSQEWC